MLCFSCGARPPLIGSSPPPLPMLPMAPSPSQIQVPIIPWEIIIDILSRLPPKSLLRFRCVAKQWCSLIDGPDFVKMHLKQSYITQTNLSLILGFLGIYSIDFDKLDSAEVLRPPFSSSDVSNSCNGLVVFFGQNQTPFLWNPSTKKYKTLPDCPVESPRGMVVESTYKRYGFGYVPEEDDYKILRVVEFRGFDSIWIGSKAKLYSLKSNSWRRVENYPYPLPRIRGWGVHVNGALHTVLHLDNYPEQSIVAFDLRDHRNYTLSKPDFVAKDLELSVHAMAGCLCLLGTRKKKHRTYIWIMKEYGVKESWTKLLSIAPPDIEPYSIVFPLAYSKRGDEVILNCNDERLVWYDLSRKSTREVEVSGLPFRFYADVFVGSLIPLENEFAGRVYEMVRMPVRQVRRQSKETRKKRDAFLSEGFKLVL